MFFSQIVLQVILPTVRWGYYLGNQIYERIRDRFYQNIPGVCEGKKKKKNIKKCGTILYMSKPRILGLYRTINGLYRSNYLYHLEEYWTSFITQSSPSPNADEFT